MSRPLFFLLTKIFFPDPATVKSKKAVGQRDYFYTPCNETTVGDQSVGYTLRKLWSRQRYKNFLIIPISLRPSACRQVATYMCSFLHPAVLAYHIAHSTSFIRKYPLEILNVEGV